MSSASRLILVALDFCRSSSSFSAPAAPRTAVATPLPVEPSPNALFSASRSGASSSSVVARASSSAALTSAAAAANASAAP
jgi:hypothetical protein